MDVNGKFGILYFLFSGVYAYNSNMEKVVPHRNGNTMVWIQWDTGVHYNLIQTTHTG